MLIWRRLVSGALGGLAMALSAVVPAAAHDHEPSRVSLKAGDRTFAATPWTFTWIAPGGGPGVCVVANADGFPRYDPDPPLVDARVARIRFAKRQRPRRVVVRAARSLDEHGLPAAPLERVPVTLEPGRRGGTVRSWRARVALSPGRPYFLDVRAVWRGTDDCGGQQDLSLAFALRTE